MFDSLRNQGVDLQHKTIHLLPHDWNTGLEVVNCSFFNLLGMGYILLQHILRPHAIKPIDLDILMIMRQISIKLWIDFIYNGRCLGVSFSAKYILQCNHSALSSDYS